MKTQDARDRELFMWRWAWGMSVGGVIGVILAEFFTGQLGSLAFMQTVLSVLVGLWLIALPVVYLIDVRPRQRRERRQSSRT